MPDFTDINNVIAPEKKLNDVEVLRAIKFGIASEFEAIQIYQQIMESTDNQDIKAVLSDITSDEMHHAGALYKLLQILSPDDEAQYQRGMQEALDHIAQANAEKR